jgi:hypothetical protein
MVVTGNAGIDITVETDDSSILAVVAGIAAVNETNALHDDGNGAVETSIEANVSTVGAVVYSMISFTIRWEFFAY